MKTTLKDIAAEAGVSITTVSKILNNNDVHISKNTRERVLGIAKRRKYVPNAMAKGLRAKSTRLVGVILPDIANPFFAMIVRGIEDTAKKSGFGVVFCNTDNDPQREAECFGFLNSRMVDGIIFARSLDTCNLESFLENGLPMVIVDREIDTHNLAVGKVYVDTISAIRDATNHLIEAGCRRIAYISAAQHSKYDRFLGYTGALEAAGIPYDESLIYKGAFDVETGCKGFETILPHATPDGVICGNDLIAAGVLITLGQKGYRVPQDVKVVGMDDTYMSRFLNPPLTTIRQPAYEMGANAAQILLDCIISGSPLSKKQLDYMLVLRESG